MAQPPSGGMGSVKPLWASLRAHRGFRYGQPIVWASQAIYRPVAMASISMSAVSSSSWLAG